MKTKKCIFDKRKVWSSQCISNKKGATSGSNLACSIESRTVRGREERRPLRDRRQTRGFNRSTTIHSAWSDGKRGGNHWPAWRKKMIVNKTALPYGSSWHELISASPLPILWIWTSTSLLRPFFLWFSFWTRTRLFSLLPPLLRNPYFTLFYLMKSIFSGSEPHGFVVSIKIRWRSGSLIWLFIHWKSRSVTVFNHFFRIMALACLVAVPSKMSLGVPFELR